MPFFVSFDPELFCVVTRVTGDLDRRVVSNFFAEVGRVATSHGCARVLSDLREARVVGDPIDIYNAVGELQEHQITRTFRRAIVVSRDHADYRFWETACKNQGFHAVRIFEDMEAARAWILQQPREQAVLTDPPKAHERSVITHDSRD